MKRIKVQCTFFITVSIISKKSTLLILSIYSKINSKYNAKIAEKATKIDAFLAKMKVFCTIFLGSQLFLHLAPPIIELCDRDSRAPADPDDRKVVSLHPFSCGLGVFTIQ